MRRLLGLLSSFLLFVNCIQPVLAQKPNAYTQVKPIETTVCKILEDPASFNNKLVRVRGHVFVNFEYSVIDDDGCLNGIWFSYGDGSTPPGLSVTVNGSARPGTTSTKGRRGAPIRVTLLRDSNFERFEKLLTSTVKADARPENMRFVGLLTATFVGRIDGVSNQIHKAHQQRHPNTRPDFKGFGQMGLFDAQLVIQTIESDSFIETIEIFDMDFSIPPAVPFDPSDTYPLLFPQHHNPIP